LDGRWVAMKGIADPIAVKGKSTPFPFERESTAHGVIVASDRERHLAFTVRWTGFEPGGAAELGSLAVDRAQSTVELRQALERWKLPAATFVFATRDGEVGTEAAGWVPVRTSWNGTVPAPGWSGRCEWRGFRSERDRPDARAVRLGYAVSANDSIPRLRRIEQAFAASTSFGTDGFEQLQHDTQAWNAEQLVPLLAAVRSDRVEIEEARSRLLQWDRRLGAESSEATLYVLWE